MRKKILLFSPIGTHPQNQGNRSRVYTLASILQMTDNDVYFFFWGRFDDCNIEEMRDYWSDKLFIHYHNDPLKLPIGKRLIEILKKTVAKVSFRLQQLSSPLNGPPSLSVDAWYDRRIDEILIKLQKHYGFDVVIAEYVFSSKALTAFGHGVLKVLDTHDVFSARTRALWDRGEYDLAWFPLNPSQERIGLNRADVVLAIQSEEAELLRRLTNRRVVQVGHLSPVQPAADEPDTKIILFVGGYNNINRIGFEWFATNVFPQVRKEVPRAEWWIAGPIGQSLTAPISGVKLLGSVKDLRELYASAAVVINPVQVGSGLAIKTVEGLAAGRPVVTTSAGARGLGYPATEAFIKADDASSFARAVVALLLDRDRRTAVASEARRFAAAFNQQQLKGLDDILSTPVTINKESGGIRR